MGERKHTPGPWGYIFTDEGIVVDANSGKTDVAIVAGRADDSVEIANARLLAAAPELLDALNEIVRQIDQGGSGAKVFARDSCIATARSIIAKATGEAVRGLDVLA